MQAAPRVHAQRPRQNASDVMALNDLAPLRRRPSRQGGPASTERPCAPARLTSTVLDDRGGPPVAQNRERETIGPLTRAAELAPEFEEIRYHVAATQARLRKLSEARAALEEALSGSQPFESRAAARALLETINTSQP